MGKRERMNEFLWGIKKKQTLFKDEMGNRCVCVYAYMFYYF